MEKIHKTASYFFPGLKSLCLFSIAEAKVGKLWPTGQTHDFICQVLLAYILSMAAFELRADMNSCRDYRACEAENIYSAPLRKSLSNHGLAPGDLH